jgi:hypothetical protein
MSGSGAGAGAEQVTRGGQVRIETTCMVDGGKRESFVMHASLCPLFPTS